MVAKFGRFSGVVYRHPGAEHGRGSGTTMSVAGTSSPSASISPSKCLRLDSSLEASTSVNASGKR